ncbi:MAG TPA: hypothetical protein VEQ60_11490 [Longimicrobium sp.]|nr:hypothetical protein [Longimicrobium sp.]
MASNPAESDHFARSVAYSTGLILGVCFVQILRHWIRAHSDEDNAMKSIDAVNAELLEDLPENCTVAETDHILRVRSKIRRGDADYEQGRTLTHEEFQARMAPWLTG